MNKDVRAAVMERAGGRCEGCGTRFDDSLKNRETLDHFFGRKHAPETVENCWALDWECHEAKTRNEPNAAFWIRAFRIHATDHDYEDAYERATKKLEWVHCRAAFAK